MAERIVNLGPGSHRQSSKKGRRKARRWRREESCANPSSQTSSGNETRVTRVSLPDSSSQVQLTKLSWTPSTDPLDQSRPRRLVRRVLRYLVCADLSSVMSVRSIGEFFVLAR